MLVGKGLKRPLVDQALKERIEIGGEIGVGRLRVLLANLRQAPLHRRAHVPIRDR
jgi:hypothetical protein